MLFSSIPFLYTFLPCVLILYFLVPGWLKNTVLLLSSLFFYALGEPRFVVFMVIAIVQGYVFGLLAEKFRDRPKRAKLCLWASAVVSLGLLGYCKYADFFISGFNTLTGLSLPLLHVALPIGISFYTFQILSYVIDVYRGDVTAQRNLIDLAEYVAMFPPAHRRAYRPVRGYRPPAEAAHPHAGRCRLRRPPLHPRPFQKGAAGQCPL